MMRISGLLLIASLFANSGAAMANEYACKVWCEGRGGVVRARLGSINVQAPDSGQAQDFAKQQVQETCNNFGFHGPTPHDGGRASAYADCWTK